MEDDDFNFSTHFSPYLEENQSLSQSQSLSQIQKPEPEDRARSQSQSQIQGLSQSQIQSQSQSQKPEPEPEPDPESDPETPCHNDKHEAEDQLSCEFLTHSFLWLPAVLLLLAYLQIVSAIPCLYCFFNPLRRWRSNLSNLLDMKLFFVVSGLFMPYFHLPPFVKNEQCGEGEMSQDVVFVYFIFFLSALTLSPLEVCRV